MALFVPVLSGEAHAARAIAAGQADLTALEVPELVAGGVSVGVGVHTGRAFVGAVGTAERIDSSALGDTVNAAARLGSVAGGGELLVSSMAWDAGGAKGAPGMIDNRRPLILSGRTAPLDVVVVRSRCELAEAG